MWLGLVKLSYVGELTINRLRREASAAWGPFDLRAFHDEVLGRGALPSRFEVYLKQWVTTEESKVGRSSH